MHRYYYITFPIFWYIQGTFFWALFVIGHDCGHGSFSENEKLNHLIGHLSHIPILVPYHSWRISHHKHHLNTGNIKNDESWVAVSESEYKKFNFRQRFFRYHCYFIGGWIAYLLFGMPPKHHSHFLPSSILFNEQERHYVRESLIWWFLFCSFLFYIGWKFGFLFLLKYYFIPDLIFGGWISIVTLLHHTHPNVPWYRNDEWNFLRGALSSVDRNYGFIEDIHHNIGTHIVHHIFMKIPHYHLKEASDAIKPKLGKFYKKSNENIFMAMLRTWYNCRFVPDNGNLVFFEGVKSAGYF
jgi:omega-3 fatty acid desaturase (delta-15 desaturase)